ncbi:MAG: glycosyltransferase family 4 protein [Methanothrix sp.]|nr:glycosyltransferase family 4 protein [Methanothrix sp.]
MKILQISPRYHPDIGGVETHVKEISERLAERGFEVEVVSTDPTGRLPENEIINGVAVRRFRSIAPDNAYFFAPQIYLYLKRARCDVIHAHGYHALPAFFAAMAKGDRKFVFTPHYHGRGHTPFRDLLHKPYRLIGSRIFEAADRVVCVSLFERGLLETDFDVPGERIERTTNGINLDEFQCDAGEKDLSKILYVGRLEEYKGVQHIIRALPHLGDRRLVVVGRGPYEGELKRLAEDLGVEERVEWLRDLSREELLDHYRSAGVFVMLSSFEAFGITVAEALASGTPCIVAEGSALEEFVDGKTCVGLSRPIVVDQLVERIGDLSGEVVGEGDLRRDNIRSWDEVADQHVKLYERLVG